MDIVKVDEDSQNRLKSIIWNNDQMVTKPMVSVIIPSFNRKKYLGYVLPSYLAQEYVCEVIIVDDGSTEDYSKLIEHATLEAKKRGVEIIYLRHEQRRGAPAGRNSGIEASKGNLLLFSDDDVVLSDNFVSKAVTKMLASGADIVGSRIIPVADYRHVGRIPPCYNTKKEVFDWLTLRGHFFANPGRDVEVPFVSAVSMWKKWIFDRGTKFDEAYGGNGYREETSAQIDASKLGAKIMFMPKLVAWHIRMERAGGQWRGSTLWWYIWAIRNNLKFLRKNYQYLKHRWGLKYPWWISFLSFSFRETSVLLPEPAKQVLRKLFEVMKSKQRKN